MADRSALLVEERERNLVVIFNRPEIRSPLSVEVVEQLFEIISGVAGAERVIFTGVGNVFASGADLREIAAVGESDAAAFALRGQRLMHAIADLEVPTVAAVNGICFGGALDLALACGRRIASTNAVFAHPGADLGIITGWGGTQRLPRRVGQAIASEMFFTAKRVSAEEAYRIGLVDEIAEDVVDRALSA